MNVIDLDTGILDKYGDKVVRKASNMRGFYGDEEALEKLIKSGDPIIYEVYSVPREGEGELSYGVTILHPGTVGGEFYMTKGHYHEKKDRAEIYMGIRGHGLLLMQNGNEVKWEEMQRGTIVYVPPFWAHRSINTGNEDFIFLAIYPGDAGHDYGSIAERGFAKLVIKDGEDYKIIDNPRYR